MTLSPAFTLALRQAIHRQARAPFDAVEYAIAAVRAREQGASGGEVGDVGREWSSNAND